MSIESQVDRIKANVQDTINTIQSTGVTVPPGANSDNLPGLAAALANEKQDKLTGQQGQVVGFDAEGNAVAQDQGASNVSAENVSVPDTTAALYGLEDATVDQVLSLLSRFQSGLGNEYLWSKSKVVTYNGFNTEETQSNYTIFSNANSSKTYYYADSYSIDDTFSVSLVDPQSIVITGGQAYEPTSFDVFKGKYLLGDTDTYENGNSAVYVPSDSTVSVSGAGMSLSAKFSLVRVYSDPGQITETQNFGYVNSPNPSAYPPSVSDGYTYTPLGQLGNKVQIATGSYAGTGTYGEDNPNSFTFDGKPVFVIIGLVIPNNQYGHASFGLFSTTFLISEYGNAGYAYFRNDSLMTIGYAKLDGNTLYWYSENGSNAQLNSSYNYYVFALVV